MLRSLLATCFALLAACGPDSARDGGADPIAARDAAAPAPAPDSAAPPDAPPAPPPPDTLTAPDPAMVAHVRELVARGAARGNRREVLAKVGDSITETASFLQDCGRGFYELGEHAGLEPTIRYFSAVMLDADTNSLSRASLAARGGWTVRGALNGGDPVAPLARELDAIRPQWAIVMFGTNDLDHTDDVAVFRADLARLLDMVESRDVVPILSTVPPRLDAPSAAARVAPFNAAIRALAAERRVPWVDYWLALSRAPDLGLSDDGIHPNIYRDAMGTRGCVFTPAAVAFGYNLRNLTALQVLERLRSF